MSYKSLARRPPPSKISPVPFFTPSARRPSAAASPIPSSNTAGRLLAAAPLIMDSIKLPRARFQVHLPQITWTHKGNTDLVLSPVEVDLELQTDLSAAGKSDKIGETLSYSDLYKAAKGVASGSGGPGQGTFKGGIQQLASEVAQSISLPPKSSLKVHVNRPKSVLSAESIYVTTTHRSDSVSQEEEVGIKKYRIQSTIGLWEHERHQPQPMELDVACVLRPGASWAVDAMLRVIEKHVEHSHPALLETYLEDLAASMLASLPLQQVTLEVHKPFGNIYTEPPQVKITRRQQQSSSSIASALPYPLKADATTIMGIINLTPDSFATAPSTLDFALALAQEHLQAGATILDLGAMSTRPGASDVPAEIELERLFPFIRALRATEWGREVTLSIDTFRASVADAALEAGANWINDVQSGAHTGDGNMWDVAKKWQCPIILMHMRGDPSNMTKLTEYGRDPVTIIRDELNERIQKALEAGVAPEQIIVDPGLGFAKDGPTNWMICQRLQEWHQQGSLARYPLLVGASRKRFLGDLTGKDAGQERDAATAGLMLDCIRQGTDIVRVHSSAAVQDVVKVADRLYRHR